MALFLPILKQRGYLDAVPMTLCSVGSRKTSENHDFGTQAWGLFAPNLAIYGFDADADACEMANADLAERRVNWTERHFPYAIADRAGAANLYVTQDPQCSSLFPPNEVFLNRFDQLRDLVRLEFFMEMETTTLDAVWQQEQLRAPQFCQIDVQGANLNVLRGAAHLLETSVLAVQIEVEFSPLYVGEPLFAEVDQWLRDRGFVLFDLTTARCHRGTIQSARHPGQLLWGDGFYFRDPLQAPEDAFWTTPEQILQLACIADALDFTDYALELLVHLTVTYGKQPEYNMADAIVESLSKVPSLMAVGWDNLPPIAALLPYLAKPLPASDPALTTTDPEPVFATPIESFHSEHYLRHNQRRLEHLASLGLDLVGRSVLEVGAGIGDHTSFFLDRQCQVVCTEGRFDNLEVLQQRFPRLPVQHLDLNQPRPAFEGTFDVVYCYGLLYHLHDPVGAIAFMSDHCQDLLLLETCVSYGNHEAINPCEEPEASPTQSISGQGCRPTRPWVFKQLKQHFPYVYMPVTQPCHEEFWLDWTQEPPPEHKYIRAVFIASRRSLDLPLLVQDIPLHQHY